MTAPTLSIIIPTRNRLSDLRRCLNALSNQDVPKEVFEVIVVDDHSEVAVFADYEQTSRQFPNLCVLFTSLRNHEKGAARARNRGVHLARGKIVGFLDDDSVPTIDWVGIVIASFSDHSHVTAITGHINAIDSENPLSAFRQNFYNARRNRLLTREYSERMRRRYSVDMTSYPLVDFLAGGNSAVRRDTLLKVGAFNENYRMMHDKELALRLLQNGYICVFVPKLQIKHNHTKSVRDAASKSFVSGRYHFHLLREHAEVDSSSVIDPIQPFRIISDSRGFLRSLKWRASMLLPFIFLLEYCHQLGYAFEMGLSFIQSRKNGQRL